MHFSYYILAAGHGRRAGGPKAWRLHEGRPLLAHHVDFLSRRVAPASIAISIQADWLPRCRALNEQIHWVATDPDASPLASLQCLTQALPLTNWSFVYHVDMPLWGGDVFESLALACAASTAEAIVPTYLERGGHPVVLAASLASQLTALDPSAHRLDHWLRSRRTQHIPVNDPAVLENWNEPAK